MPNIIEITDFLAPELDIFARKTENQLLNREHPEDGIFIAESPKVVERALDASCQRRMLPRDLTRLALDLVAEDADAAPRLPCPLRRGRKR